jgi:hypothetical protein
MNKYTEDITLNTNLIKYLDNDLTESEGVLIKEWIDDSLENKAYRILRSKSLDLLKAGVISRKILILKHNKKL